MSTDPRPTPSDASPAGALHAAIMNLPSNTDNLRFACPSTGERNAYRTGHRDARHAAAELALTFAPSPDDASPAGARPDPTETDRLREFRRVALDFLQHLESTSSDIDADEPRVDGIDVDGQPVKLTSRVVPTWLALCEEIDRACGMPTPAEEERLEGVYRSFPEAASMDAALAAPPPPAATEPTPSLVLTPSTILDVSEMRTCHECGNPLAGMQAHFDRQGDAYCTICAPYETPDEPMTAEKAREVVAFVNGRSSATEPTPAASAPTATEPEMIECRECSIAGGADMPVFHEAPACHAPTAATAGEGASL